VRGIHYSLAPGGQAKLVAVMNGSIEDYAIDIRRDSSTFGEYESVTLKAGDGRALLLASDLAHAFLSLEDQTVVSYLVSSEFNPQAEKAISPLCPDIGINWSIAKNQLVLSEKDFAAPQLSEMQSLNLLP
jgi:dTDP-4-dehydrorhamnose 3,5-epimerase